MDFCSRLNPSNWERIGSGKKMATKSRIVTILYYQFRSFSKKNELLNPLCSGIHLDRVIFKMRFHLRLFPRFIIFLVLLTVLPVSLVSHILIKINKKRLQLDVQSYHTLLAKSLAV